MSHFNGNGNGYFPHHDVTEDNENAFPENIEGNEGEYDEEDNIETQVANESTLEPLIAQYFGDVRQYALLTRDQERDLWNRIETAKERLRRIIHSHTAFPDLLRDIILEAQEVQGLIQNCKARKPTALSVDWRKRVNAIISDCRKHRKAMSPRRKRMCKAAVPALRRKLRLAYAKKFRQWHSRCEELNLTPLFYEKALAHLSAINKRWLVDSRSTRAVAALKRRDAFLLELQQRMLRANVRLVIYVAARYTSSEMHLLDRIQEGNIGLMRALDKFEPKRGLKFVTYAHWWVRQAISRGIIEQSWNIRLPGYISQNKSRLATVENRLYTLLNRPPTLTELSIAFFCASAQRENHPNLWKHPPAISDLNGCLYKKFGREPTTDEIAKALKAVEKETEEAQCLTTYTVSINHPAPGIRENFGEIIEDKNARAQEDAVFDDQCTTITAEYLAHLTPREADILRQRHGIDCDKPQTLREIGQKLGLSRERIRQLEAQAIIKLREYDAHRAGSKKGLLRELYAASA
ncbi:MAG: RNA polymerase sigma factor RpoD/SigA [Patescibacteria group bacterium]